MVFGISQGKIRSEELSMIRKNGTAASGVVENGTASQYASLESLEYIKQTGRCVTVGTAETAGEDPVWKVKRLRSARSDGQIRTPGRVSLPCLYKIHGSYPEKEQEIMLSEKALKALEITDPKEGMEISLHISLGLFQRTDEIFFLSGWFADHSNGARPWVYFRGKAG